MAAPQEDGVEALSQVGMCPDCGKGTVWRGDPNGHEETIGGLRTYVSLPPTVRTPTAAIVYAHDILGYQFPNARLLADRIAAASGLPVYLPDLFVGDKIEMDLKSFDKQPTGILDRIARTVRVVAKAPAIISVVSRHPPAAAIPRIAAVLADVRARHGGDAARIGMVGYCWGGKYALRFNAMGEIAATVGCHPSAVKLEEDVRGIRAPTLLILAEGDGMFPAPLQAASEGILAGAGVPSETIVFPGVKHGFCVRGDVADPTVAAARDAACARTAEWFVRHLTPGAVL